MNTALRFTVWYRHSSDSRDIVVNSLETYEDAYDYLVDVWKEWKKNGCTMEFVGNMVTDEHKKSILLPYENKIVYVSGDFSFSYWIVDSYAPPSSSLPSLPSLPPYTEEEALADLKDDCLYWSNEKIDRSLDILDNNRLATLPEGGLNPIYDVVMSEQNRRWVEERKVFAASQGLTVYQVERKNSLIGMVSLTEKFAPHQTINLARWKEELEAISEAARINLKLSATYDLPSRYIFVLDSYYPNLSMADNKLFSGETGQDLEDRLESLSNCDWEVKRIDWEGSYYTLTGYDRVIVIHRVAGVSVNQQLDD